MHMLVEMFSANRGYGFCSDLEGRSVFFHAADFHRIEPGGPPPILGEQVIVEGPLEEPSEDGKAPRATRVTRVASRSAISGIVKSFDPKAGWGFVVGPEGCEYFLHRSDVIGSRIPISGVQITFYPCERRGKPRACHVVTHGG